MPVIHSGLFLIIRRFLPSRDRLHRLYVSDQSFRILCDDYLLCTDVLAYWKRSGRDKAQDRYLEYGELKLSLEQEIEDFLEHRQVPEM